MEFYNRAAYSCFDRRLLDFQTYLTQMPNNTKKKKKQHKHLIIFFVIVSMNTILGQNCVRRKMAIKTHEKHSEHKLTKNFEKLVAVEAVKAEAHLVFVSLVVVAAAAVVSAVDELELVCQPVQWWSMQLL